MSQRRPIAQSLFWFALAGFWLFALARPLGPLPALGPLFDLHSGIWSHREFEWRDLRVSGLQQPVSVAIDVSGVPHLFATNEADLYLAQGYVMASQRLFQMDLSSRATSGHLAELVGARGLDRDRYFVRFGMRASTTNTLRAYLENPQTALMIDSFVKGINAYIETLSELPVEYQLLGRRPQPFDASRVVDMAKALTFSLSGRSADLEMSHLQQQLGTEKVLDLFPEFFPEEFSDYIISARWGHHERDKEDANQFKFQTHLRHFLEIPKPAKGNGSNNWAIGPEKSKTGHSILANDTHLGLSLPNIWFENQLTCPGFNVYGVSLVDVPGIINGFTAKTAWGPTNGTTDALDYYEVEFTGPDSTEYKVGSTTVKADLSVEKINRADGPSEDVTVVKTKWGPVVYREGIYGLVANWTGHRSGNELAALRKLYDGRDLKGCLEAFKDWRVPIQNFVCADADHIGIIHAGFIPRRAIGEGRFIEPAGQSTYALSEAIPEGDRPLQIDPPEGFVRSANERVMGPSYPYAMGWDYEEPFRGRTIRQRLAAQGKFSGEDMMALQNDDSDPLAEMTLTMLLKSLNSDGLTALQKTWVERLGKWDRHASYDRAEPTLFRTWYYELKDSVFKKWLDLPENKNFSIHHARFGWFLQRLYKDSEDSDAQWLDGRTLAQTVTSAFTGAWQKLEREKGLDPARWIWKDQIRTHLPHVAKIPGLGSEVLNFSGAAESVRGNNGWHGAVYKFVIELGPDLKAWMQVPGGASGDPFSPKFERDVESWSRGEMRKVEFYSDLTDARRRGAAIYTFEPKDRP